MVAEWRGEDVVWRKPRTMFRQRKREKKQELNCSETSCDKIERCRGKIEITGTGSQKVSFSMAGMCLGMDELLKKDVGQDSRFYAMGVSCGQAP
jgi:hypothetical protein